MIGDKLKLSKHIINRITLHNNCLKEHIHLKHDKTIQVSPEYFHLQCCTYFRVVIELNNGLFETLLISDRIKIYTDRFKYTITLSGNSIGDKLFQVYSMLSFTIENNYRPFFLVKPTEKIFNSIPIRPSENMTKYKIWKERPNTSIFQKINSYHNTILQGSFQNIEYFNRNSDAIYKYLNIESIKKSLDVTGIIKNSCALYISDIGLSPNYYIKAIEFISNISDVKTINIFCNIPTSTLVATYISSLIKAISKIWKYTILNITTTNSEDLILKMSLCKVNVITNDVDSFFAGYLNISSIKIITYPYARNPVINYPNDWYPIAY